MYLNFIQGGVLTNKKKSANSGIDALLGFEFQRNCALLILLTDYNQFSKREFFLSIEHHDDFLFCFRATCRSLIEEVHSYQAKKLSGNSWALNQRFTEVITKILEVGSNLRIDPIPKHPDYVHELVFISNSDIDLQFSPSKIEKTNGKKQAALTLNEQYCKSKYEFFPDGIKYKINEKIKEFCSEKNVIYHSSELSNLYLQWVDFPRSKRAQEHILVGLMCENFPHVSDPRAAIELLLSLFRNVESIHNQNKVITLLDSSKRIEGHEIKKAIDVIETEQKTFNLWREYSKELASSFKIPISIQNDYEGYIKNTFEFLKDMANHEHQLIRDFISNNDYSNSYSDYSKMFDAYLCEMNSMYSIKLSNVDVFFSILCSFVEYHGKALK